MIDTTLASNNPLGFRKKSLRKNIKKIKTIDKIRDKKLQYNMKREAASIS